MTYVIVHAHVMSMYCDKSQYMGAMYFCICTIVLTCHTHSTAGADTGFSESSGKRGGPPLDPPLGSVDLHGVHVM